MKQTTSLHNGNPLLNYAISRLSPEVFSHPVWMRFGKKDASRCLETLTDLLNATENLEQEDPSAACQVLLICAVYQTYAGQRYQALKAAQRALALAKSKGFIKEGIWAIWGACAISVQQGNYEQASSHLVDLQATLSVQNEWILADFLDVVRGSLFQPGTISGGQYSGRARNDSSEDLLSLTFDWLQHWGFSNEAFGPDFGRPSIHRESHATSKSMLAQSFFSIERWQGHWHTFMLGIRGELRLQWTENDAPRKTKRLSFWGSLLSSLRLHLSGRNIDAEVIDEPEIHKSQNLPPPKESIPDKAASRKKKSVPMPKKAKGKQPSAQVTTAMPIAVHMLGAFSMAIGELTVKLPTSRSLSLLKYLLLHHKQTVPREVLMDTFWPEADPETARNNLNVAMHSLRKALRTIVFLPIIIFEDGAYGLEPNLQVWLDAEEFERHVKAGQRLEGRDQSTTAVAEYETAISLYQGDFLEQNPYEEWTVLERERLRIAHLDTLDRLSRIYFSQERYAACITICQRILSRDSCREDTHYLLMLCYSRQGQYHLALRQYQICVEALRAELQVDPDPETTELYQRVHRRERV